jgi:Ca2+-binding RTX toxin-like protein
LSGGAGNDLLDGGAGLDTADYSSATAGVTVNLLVGAAQDTLGAGIDTLSSIENLTGSALADRLTGNNDANVLQGGNGNDTLIGGRGNDTLYGDAGNDGLNGGIGADTMVGGAGNDSYIVDNAGDQVIELANGGVDKVTASVDYTLAAGTSIETLQGSNATHGLILTGNELVNKINGTSFNDTLNGGGGADILSGGDGDDNYFVFGAGVKIIEDLDHGTDTVTSTLGQALAANVENLILTGAGNINGTGNAGDNVLRGNDGINKLSGEAGNDTIIGQGGRDILTGGDGNDTFVYESLSDSGPTGAARDQILDFLIGSDKIDLSQIDAIAGGADNAFNFVGSGALLHAGDLNAKAFGADTMISADVDGDHKADFQILLQGSIALSAGDFLL